MDIVLPSSQDTCSFFHKERNSEMKNDLMLKNHTLYSFHGNNSFTQMHREIQTKK